ncbi:phosphoenolpyruvate-protein phosphotransferase [Gluconacetobacter diazotrophicus PA1 5]|uniref:Phosphoenolpyruvate-protein phosphotransferase n=2 Tax=Gluconacetobacter diazotrophicus TaxID=33996 RepID=A9HDP9_GLUDA|nr:phosphoenolpyruvate--protein phosphotransferase [Gluconacetobacter diazotrophicus]ACI51659.1 phosphoenolpyruvate-protein phosphotransferase [Gluconacetobacter diazotrophicus PA1 5]MBB2155309.1 phosphoenolpyruvate--protein phosphotransferase [Gluconacetobacter diazotrophicus]TWB11003.1 phosphoenolpyruvate--protein phosphotransferase [Gluconacetobacter diazotrophicus]CAP55129.1 putative phosphoenolpyruvate-protein phosphotransferase [Gluconacetobacter diazotrophicus PA1 5]
MKTTDAAGPSSAPRRRAAGRRGTRAEHRLSGDATVRGIAIGPAAVALESPAPDMDPDARAADPAPELERLAEAVERSVRQVERLRDRLAVLPEDSQIEIGSLLEVYRRMLGPSRLQRGIRRRIVQDGLTAEAAVRQETESLALALLGGADAPVPEGEDAAAAQRRAGEFREIGRRLLRNLGRMPFRSFSALPEGAVLVTEQLRPADAALIDPSRIVAVATEEGGATDHTAIMLRALGIPAVLAAHGLMARVREGATVVVDGTAGLVVVDPTEDTLAAARGGVAEHARERQALGRLRRLPARLSSGEKLHLQANLELPAELALIAQSGASGIGLLRTEFLFINAETMPDEDSQAAIYSEIITAMAGDTTTIRVVDWGGEKHSEALNRAGLDRDGDNVNPALGVRGLRLLLRHPAILETQFAAILKASSAGPMRVMLPMVTTVPELREARDIYQRVARRLRRRGVKLGDSLPPLGIMVETPAAAIMGDALAQEAEFLAIGTNDLTMYTLAADRALADVASLYQPLHPAVLRLIQTVTEAALRQYRPISICGEIAGDPRVVPLLVGLGLRSFSMTASAVPRVKRRVRALSFEDCRRLAHRVMESPDVAEVLSLIDAFAAGG